MIRGYQESDFPFMVQIAKHAWADIFKGFREQLGDELYALLFENKYQDKEYQLRQKVEHEPGEILICERAGKVVGFLTYFLDNDRKVGVITNNAADAQCGEKGIGQEMYQAVLEKFRQMGMLTASVNTGLDEGHAPARRAYERAGFQAHLDSVTYYIKL